MKADANDDANSNIAFIQGEPAGSFSVITACAGFDESDEFDFGTQRYVSFARPGS